MTIDARHPLPGTRPLVMGAARSGLAATRLLRRLGLPVRICDQKPREALGLDVEVIVEPGVETLWGKDDPSVLEGRDFVVWSPGISIHHPTADAARARGLAILSELELGYLAAPCPLLCITGTNGKSTTTHLTGALLHATGRQVEVCGNIGRAICEVAETVGPAGLLVVEVSSFQLETVSRLKPFVATWLNLTPDHLDRHGDFESYADLKRRLFVRQDESDYAVWNADDAEVMSRRTGAGVPLEFSMRGAVDAGAFLDHGEIMLAWRGGIEHLCHRSELKIPGPHNLMNTLAALATTLPLEIPPAVLREVLGDYRGLEHRLEPVATIDGVHFVNDSKATNVGSLEVALRSFDEPVVLIAGGRDKGQDFAPLAELVGRKVRAVILIGEGADRIAQAWPRVPTTRAGSLGDAVDLAFEAAKPRGTVLLSPGCASFDMFRDFEDRGDRFKAEVSRLRLKEAHA